MGGTHKDGTSSLRTRSELVESRTNESRKISSSKKPMKMLIAEELSKESTPKKRTSNVVARLMGLDDTLPIHSTPKVTQPPCITLASVLHDGRQQQDRNFDMPIPRVKHTKNQNESRMDLVRQKFIEAKQLATNEKLLKSKEFEDALEVLSSNRDLFLKFLEEPNSIYSKHLKEFHSNPPPGQTKRITVLKPSKKSSVKSDQWRSSSSEPTRIVVLKPTAASKVRENLGFHRRDESLLSSNGYVGDESEYLEDEGASFSDSEIVTPSSRHSWDYVNKYRFPYSNRAPRSPEPRVITEAKKRLSERCALVASVGCDKEQMDMRRSSSTLGEMLAFSGKKEEVNVGRLFTSTSRSYGGEEDARMSTDSMPTRKINEECNVNLSRSKSVPVSSSLFTNNDAQVDNKPEVMKPVVLRETVKPKSMKSSLSFKGKVSRFFSRNKKIDKEELSPPTVSSKDIQPEETHVTLSNEESLEVSTSFKNGEDQDTISLKDALCLEKPQSPEFLVTQEGSPSILDKTSQNKDQPSPTSILDAPFEDDYSTSNSCDTSDTQHPSLPIEDVARSLSWDDNEDNQWYLFVQSLISASEMENENFYTIFTRFYSSDSPLDPNLLEKFLDHKEEDSKSRERRSNLKLLFDRVNETLLNIDRTSYQCLYPWCRKKSQVGVSVSEEVWNQVKDCVSCNVVSEDIDMEVGKDISGNGWDEMIRLEIDDVVKEISGCILQGLLREAM